MADNHYARQFSELQEKKFAIEEQLAGVEKELYDMEGTYLEETLELGNILRAWDGYLGTQNSSGAIRRINRFRESDRLFSASSVTSNAVAAGNKATAAEQRGGTSLKKGRKRDQDD
ncbi:histone acetyltransferase subunit NuA4-domain-containing protein [Pavlovales sp. CCMP2436]|nr:histone acetyltransferase subunit NuA4-domain-containing protein [Pavlovales sp. CCMP2436]|eukprot:CAMPEP_0179864312 /NCGR_PEP_ID=MMETSP0982-20121206/16094_1 /TAXON_ID=483367 /ORGANISM="non described non described, Strain CCMP 2436" /LENGTH=115 /DNA_ID=CAMNT_0021752645 /DNA_START=99 /DNA_END=446 /DNA_ORIENTATION=-